MFVYIAGVIEHKAELGKSLYLSLMCMNFTADDVDMKSGIDRQKLYMKTYSPEFGPKYIHYKKT